MLFLCLVVSPPIPEDVEQPIITIDDLFCKTEATPAIYYLPLSEDQVAAKLAEASNSKQLLLFNFFEMQMPACSFSYYMMKWIC